MELRIFKCMVFLGILFFSGIVGAQLADSPWPTFHGDSQRTGLSPYNTSYVDGTLKWAFQSGGGIESSPVIGENGTIYFGSHDGYLYSINREGKLNWKTKIGIPIEKEGWGHLSSTSSTPAIAKDGTVYIASRDQYLFAISSHGKEKWRFPIGVVYDSWTSPAIGADGTIYMASSSPKEGIYAINPDGSEKWHYSTDRGMSNSVTIGPDGTIYAGFPSSIKTNALVALNQDGSEKWKLTTEMFLESTPTISGDTIYIGTYTDEHTEAGLYAISSKKIKWHLALQTKEVMTTPAIAEDGTIYVGNVDGVFYAVNPNGTVKWSFDTGREIGSSVALGSDGTVYFGSSNGIFYALAPDGDEKWHYSASSVASSPAIGEDGTVYIGSWDGKLYAFGGSVIIEEETILNPNNESSNLELNVSNEESLNSELNVSNEESTDLELNVSSEELDQEEPEDDPDIEGAQDSVVQEKSWDSTLIIILAGIITILGIMYVVKLKNKH